VTTAAPRTAAPRTAAPKTAAPKTAVPKAAVPRTAAPKKEYRVVRYLREVRAEVRKVVWPSRRNTLKLTGIVLAVTAAMSIALGLIDWVFSRVFSLILR